MTRRSVAIAITQPGRAGRLLLVQRPDDDEDLPGVWGLPAASLRDGESWRDAAARAGRDKLGLALRIGELLAQGSTPRAGYTLEMRLYAAGIEAGEPAVPQPVDDVTQYQAWRWGVPVELEPAAARGSLCSRLFLRSSGG